MEQEKAADYYREEVEELTNTIRSEEGFFSGLRTALQANQFDPEKILFAAYFEDEEYHEFGAFLTEEGTAYEFTRSTEGFKKFAPNTETFKYTAFEDVKKAIEKYPQLEAAVLMNKETH